MSTRIDAGRRENSSVSADGFAGEATLVLAATGGDQEAFRGLVEPLRRELHLFCYRMLGSVEDAEDVLQEACFKAWRALAAYDQRSSFRTWMYRITTNASLDALRSRRRRVLPRDLGGPRDPALGLGEQRHDIAWVEPYPHPLAASHDPHAVAELRQSVRLAFIHALQTLPPRQRAALILRDVLDWSAAETARALGTSVAAANSALQRARAALSTDTGRRTPVPRPAGLDRNTAEVAARYVAAWEAGDMDAIVSMLAEDAIQSMPPWAAWYTGRETLRALYSGYTVWGGHPGPGVFRIIPASLNGDLVFAEYCRDGSEGPYHPLALTVARLSPDGGWIAEKLSFVDGGLLTRLGFPATLD
ncbi:RNA polymerase subunit sigma-70 [Longimicrobium terrae]|nr:RNA polymerase subunit sigma-70 [Longimicrobium terrae]NNC32741.1 RNA polymerase subunit sigma-70 [Longimicrobium terrae]